MNNVEQAIRELENMGVPVRDDKRHGGHFWVDGEADGAEDWLNYHGVNRSWGNWTINDKIISVLNTHGLYIEWQNSAIAVVYDI